MINFDQQKRCFLFALLTGSSFGCGMQSTTGSVIASIEADDELRCLPASVRIDDPYLELYGKYVREWEEAIYPAYFDKIPAAAHILYERIWQNREQLTKKAVQQAFTDARRQYSAPIPLTERTYYAMTNAFKASNELLKKHRLPNLLEDAAQLLSDEEGLVEVTRVLPTGLVSGVIVKLTPEPELNFAPYADPADNSLYWQALADILQELKELAFEDHQNRVRAEELLAEYAFVCSSFHPFLKTNWGVFYLLILQAHQFFEIPLGYSYGLDHIMWASPSIEAAHQNYKVWAERTLDADIRENAADIFRY